MTSPARTPKTAHWRAFPHPDKAYDYAGTKLEKHWARLHRGDCEPYPKPRTLQKLVAAHPALEPEVPIEKAAGVLEDAWRAYHRGDFAEAVRLGLGVGALGHNVANKAAAIYATYLEGDEEKKRALLLEVAGRAEELTGNAKTLANAWYFHALALGRYGQSISVARALAEGIGGRLQSALDQAIALEPRHADAHIAFGAYQAAVIGKVGELMARLTYGATKDAAAKHFERALELNPESAIARIEYANGLVTMFGKAKLEAATALCREAAGSTPADAMERLDVELAKAELAD